MASGPKLPQQNKTRKSPSSSALMDFSKVIFQENSPNDGSSRWVLGRFNFTKRKKHSKMKVLLLLVVAVTASFNSISFPIIETSQDPYSWHTAVNQSASSALIWINQQI